MKELTDREEKVIFYRAQEKTLKEIAVILGKSNTRETIRQIEAKALRKLKEKEKAT